MKYPAFTSIQMQRTILKDVCIAHFKDTTSPTIHKLQHNCCRTTMQRTPKKKFTSNHRTKSTTFLRIYLFNEDITAKKTKQNKNETSSACGRKTILCETVSPLNAERFMRSGLRATRLEALLSVALSQEASQWMEFDEPIGRQRMTGTWSEYLFNGRSTIRRPFKSTRLVLGLLKVI